VNHLQIDPSVGTRSEGHAYSSGGLKSGAASSEHGLAEQAKAHELVLAGDRAAAHGDYKSAASFYKQALVLNPDDTAASMGYTQVMEKMQ
jgi:Flp pilus assembly protein TadD